MRPQHAIAVITAIDGSYAASGVLLSCESDINTDALVMLARTGDRAWRTRRTARFSLADDYLFDFAILAKIGGASKSLQKLRLIADSRIEPNDIDQILLHDANASEVLAR